MPYVTLGARGPVTGKPDTSGHNPGNWTAEFTPDILNVFTSQFEVYKIIVHGAANATFNVFVQAWQWDTAVYGAQNSWDPSQPLIMRPGQTLYFCYSDPVTDHTPPLVTIWLRYDPNVGVP
jgi:hypothetical protein